ncbi:WhiB family transcriptional regulator [Rhodococcus pseudokoreensis]|uniref:Transcriptional regulator WhiB n=2 Tax=Rhodococcus pseudokoreensis TaxID=2811421 RepID=A0A974WFX4_9NOCA|nr:WhiB family transcriptional regulator [Rhodococcus pseudokoreensis]
MTQIQKPADTRKVRSRKGIAVLTPGDAPLTDGHFTTEETDWRQRAACRGVDVSVFFSPEGERGRNRTRRERQARNICQSCLVLDQCRDTALAAGEPYGVWGGLTEADRRKGAHRLRRGGHRPIVPLHPRPAPIGPG